MARGWGGGEFSVTHYVRDTHSSLFLPYPKGRLNVKNEELDAMMKEASGPINFTVFLTMFGEKLKGEGSIQVPVTGPAQAKPSCIPPPASHAF